MTAEPDGGSTGGDQHAYDDDRDTGGVDDLPDPSRPHGCNPSRSATGCSVCRANAAMRMIPVLGAAGKKARRALGCAG
jgi:hypothetical protein